MHHETASAIKDKHEPAIRAMETRLRCNPDGTITLDAKNAAELGVDPGAFANLQLLTGGDKPQNQGRRAPTGSGGFDVRYLNSDWRS